jgi:hypothetical protein
MWCVQVIQGMNFEQIDALYKRCKVVIDQGLPGAERVPLEAATYGAIVLLDDNTDNSISSEWLDFPIPADYVSKWDDKRLEDKLYHALTNYEAEMRRFEPMRRRVAALEGHFEDAVEKVFQQSALFLVPCNRPTDGANCLRAALSVLIVTPLSQVRATCVMSAISSSVPQRVVRSVQCSMITQRGVVHRCTLSPRKTRPAFGRSMRTISRSSPRATWWGWCTRAPLATPRR